MNSLLTKTKLLGLPLLLLALFFIVAYLLLFWIACILLQYEGLSEDITQLWIPMGLAFLLVLLFIRPRVHLLKLDKDNGRIRGLYYLVAATVLCLPAIIGVHYLETATGKLTPLPRISDILQKPVSRYYKPSSFVLHKDAVGIHSQWSYSGKHNRDLNFDIYMAMPFADHLYDTVGTPPAFLFTTYHKQVSASLSDAERKAQWQAFWDKSMDDFFINNKPPFVYLERIGNNKKRKYGVMAAQKTDRYRAGAPVLLLAPSYEPFAARNGNKLAWMAGSLGIALAVWLIMILIPRLHADKAKKFQTRSRLPAINWQDAWSIIRPYSGFRVTPALIGINFFVFTWMVLNGANLMNIDAAELLAAGGLYEPLVRAGEWWRMLTSMFLHGGVAHLFMNLFSLYLCGIFLEAMMGSKQFAAVYLLSGLAAAFTSMWWHQNPVVGVGASGAIFGLYGVVLAFVTTKVFDPGFTKFLLILLGATAGYSLLMGWLSPGIDNSAHVGGLLAGFAWGIGRVLIFKPQQSDPFLSAPEKKRPTGKSRKQTPA